MIYDTHTHTHTHTKCITFLCLSLSISLSPFTSLSRLPTIVAIIPFSNTVLFHYIIYIQHAGLHTKYTLYKHVLAYQSSVTGIRPSSREAEASELLRTFFTVLALSVVNWSPPNRIGNELAGIYYALM